MIKISKMQWSLLKNYKNIRRNRNNTTDAITDLKNNMLTLCIPKLLKPLTKIPAAPNMLPATTGSRRLNFFICNNLFFYNFYIIMTQKVVINN